MNAVQQKIEPSESKAEEQDGMDLELGDDPEEKAVYERFMKMMKDPSQ